MLGSSICGDDTDVVTDVGTGSMDNSADNDDTGWVDQF